ncbi:TetR family transcriptional regulator [Nocardia sp. NBC_00565]|uniref:acyl-CoA-like ligand-binding transcription factor n=1 Tax=Nocardia sp. NBC_00565 TaxID=2975993 RepID=UPI002E818F4B|nr:TetR family transcriptional regulator [Nocardia sp. NBC_00565]WUC06243.1 TetR family transcriptional regulator [Nocardia sp. NBC_00565]
MTSTTRRGRPRETDARRLELSALRLFATQGFEQTTVEQIAVGVGVSKRTFFRYFDSKVAVLWHAFDTEIDAIRAGLAEAPAELPIIAAVRHGVLAANRRSSMDLAELRVRITLLRAVPELMASATRHYEAWARVIADFVAQRTGQPADSLYPLAIGRATLAICRAAYDQWAPRADHDLATYLDLALRGLEAGFADSAITAPEPGSGVIEV